MTLLKRLFHCSTRKTKLPSFELPYCWQSKKLQLNNLHFNGYFYHTNSSTPVETEKVLKTLLRQRSHNTIQALDRAKGLLLALQSSSVEGHAIPVRLLKRSLFQVMAILRFCLIESYRHYQSPEENLWLALHQVYLLSVSLSIESEHLGSRLFKDKNSLHSMYSECILLALSNPYHLSPKEFQQSLSLIKTLAPSLNLHARQNQKDSIYIDIHQDLPPYHAEKLSSAGHSKEWCVCLDDTLHLAQSKMREETFPADKKQIMFNLARQWNHPANRDFPRTPAQEPLCFCFGIEHLHACLSHSQSTNRLQVLEVINVSPGGLCISVKDYDQVDVSVNTLIGIFPADESAHTLPMLGVVRWIKQEKAQRLLGIQTIAMNPTPLSLNADHDKSLFLTHKQGAHQIRSIISKHLPKKAQLSVDSDGKQQLFRVVSLLESFGELNRYEVVSSE